MNSMPEKIWLDNDGHWTDIEFKDRKFQFPKTYNTEYIRADLYQELMQKLFDAQSIAMDRGNQLINLIAKKESEWQSIETAPKDGTIIDVWLDYGVRVPDVCWAIPFFRKNNSVYQWCYMSFDESFGSVLFGIDGMATHWIPLPKGPNE
jgi:hypothetical protein